MSATGGPPGAPEAPSGPGLPGPVAPVDPYRSPHALSRWTMGLLVAGAVIELLLLLGFAVTGTLIGQPEPAQPGEVSGALLLASVVGVVQGGVTIATAVLFIVWFYRAYANLGALGAGELRYGTGWAAGAWFVPILNLFRPKQIADDIWRASDPELGEPGAWRSGPVPVVYGVWWTAWLAWIIGGTAVAVATWVTADSIFTIRPLPATTVIFDVIAVVTAALAYLVVKQTTERQEVRARRVFAWPAEAPG